MQAEAVSSVEILDATVLSILAAQGFGGGGEPAMTPHISRPSFVSRSLGMGCVPVMLIVMELSGQVFGSAARTGCWAPFSIVKMVEAPRLVAGASHSR